MNWINNFIIALKDQGPPERFIRNLVTFRLRSVLHPNSHTRKDTKQAKICYGSKESAIRAANNMGKKVGAVFGPYKCFYCSGYHIGKNTNDTANY